MTAFRILLFTIAAVVLLAGPGCVSLFMAADSPGGLNPRIDPVSYSINIRDGFLWDTIWILAVGTGFFFMIWDLCYLVGAVGNCPHPSGAKLKEKYRGP